MTIALYRQRKGHDSFLVIATKKETEKVGVRRRGSIRQHTSEYVSIRQHTSAYVKKERPIRSVFGEEAAKFASAAC